MNFNLPCPACSQQLQTWYSMDQKECRCECANPQCILNQKQVRGTGDRTQEAVDSFMEKALRVDGNLALRKAKA